MESYSYRGVARLLTTEGEPVAETSFWVNVQVPPKGKVIWEGWLRKAADANPDQSRQEQDSSTSWQGRYRFVVVGGGEGQIEIADEGPMKLLDSYHVRFRGVSRPPSIPAAPTYPQNPVPYPPDSESD